MHPYVLIPLAACVTAFAVAGAAWARDPGRSANRISALIMVATGYWALCEVMWNLAPDAHQAVRVTRLSSIGFLWFGPLGIHLHAALDRKAVPRLLLRALPWLYAATPLFIAAYVFTDWFVAGAEFAPWGWMPIFTPAVLPVTLWLAAYPLWVVVPIVLGRNPIDFAQRGRRSIRAIAAGLAVATLTTEVLLPGLGVVVPRIGSALVSAVAVVALFGLYRHGYGVVTLRGLAHELLDAFPDGVALLRLDGRIRSANANLARLTGSPRSRLRGLHFSELVPDADLDTDVQDVQKRFETRDGETFPVSFSASLLRAGGDVLGTVVAVRDLRPALQLRSRLVTTGRLSAVGEMAASITHEINNPIAFVRTNLGLLDAHLEHVGKVATVMPGLEDLVEKAAEGREMVEDTLRGADRVIAIVRDVRSFSSAGHGESEVADLNQLCEEALRVFMPRIPDGVNLVREYRDLASLPCAPRAVVQVLLNLLTNAAQAVSNHGTIRVYTLQEDDAVVVRVEDDGEGIPASVVEHIFDPFFTTKPVGEGTGLGLAISREIIADHGGDLVVESRDGGGTVFSVRLPLGPREEDR